MGWFAFMLLDLLPFIIDLLVPILLIGYGILTRNVFSFVCGCLYLYAVWGPILAEGKANDIQR